MSFFTVSRNTSTILSFGGAQARSFHVASAGWSLPSGLSWSGVVASTHQDEYQGVSFGRSVTHGKTGGGGLVSHQGAPETLPR